MPPFENLFEMVRDYEEKMQADLMKSLGVAPEHVNRDYMSPDIEGDVTTRTILQDVNGHGNYAEKVMVLLVIPPELCQGVQTAICKRLDGNGSRLKAMAPWVANAGIAAGIDPDEKVVIATKWELS